MGLIGFIPLMVPVCSVAPAAAGSWVLIVFRCQVWSGMDSNGIHLCFVQVVRLPPERSWLGLNIDVRFRGLCVSSRLGQLDRQIAR